MAKQVDNYVTFVALDPIIRNASASFSVYTEPSTGDRKYISDRRDPKTGEDIMYRFKFGRDKRYITIPIKKSDINGVSWVEFLRNHPYNANSPIAVKNPWFKELDNDRDAHVAIDSVKLRNKAENKAINLKESEVEEIAKVFGFSGTHDIKFHKILQYASKNPSDFLEQVEDPNRDARAIFNEAVKQKIIVKKGFRYIYQDAHIGNDADKSIIKISEDKELKQILSDAIKKAGA
jgi:hypothetical protein